MNIKWLFLCFIFFFSFTCVHLSSHSDETEKYLLPKEHPIYEHLEKLFLNPDMFLDQERFREAGFSVFTRMNRGLMVASHPSIRHILFKKFKNEIPADSQLENYLSRIKGSRALRSFIGIKGLQNIVVPRKWLYPLPKAFADPKTKKKTYILIVEEMDLCSRNENVRKYYSIEKSILRELCIVLHQFRGLDSILSNMPFTKKNKIAFIDTEKWSRKRGGFLNDAKPYLSPESKAYVQRFLKEFDE
jgi:hypothetical protein